MRESAGLMAIETQINGALSTDFEKPLVHYQPQINGTITETHNGALTETHINGALPETHINGALTKTPINGAEKPVQSHKSLIDLTRDSLESAAQYSRHIQNSDGHWCGELRSNPTVTCEYVFLHQQFGLDLTPSRESIRPWLLSQQKDDGSWGIAPDYPGDVSTSVEAYFALKLLQVPAEDPVMQRARAFVLSVGGLAKVRIFTRIYLATFGLFSWNDIPEMPAELIYVSLNINPFLR